MNFLRRVWAISSKELRQLSRDRSSFGMLVMIPLVQLILFGYAINTDVRHLRAAVADQSNSGFSRDLIAQLQATQVVDFVDRAATAEELEAMIRVGHVSVGLFIPADALKRHQSGTRKIAQLLMDGSDPVVVGAVAPLRSAPINWHSSSGSAFAEGALELRVFYNPEKRSAVNVVPGLVGVILTFTMVLFTAIAVVREKEHGNLELLISTPVSSLQLMLGKVLPYVFIGLLQAALIIALGYWLFKIPINGGLFDIFAACVFFIVASLTLGLLISSIAQTQLQAMQMTIFVFVPSILLSGFMFPFDGMPKFAQYISELLPLTHFLRIIRGLILRGADLIELYPELLALAAFGFVTLLLSVLRFNKSLD